MNEVIIEENDVSKALLEYIANNYIENMVVGASTRNALSRYIRKGVPSFEINILY